MNSWGVVSLRVPPCVWCVFIGCPLGAHRSIDHSFEGKDSYQFGFGSLSFFNLLLVWFATNDEEVSLFCEGGDVFPPVGCYKALQSIITHIKMTCRSQL